MDRELERHVDAWDRVVAEAAPSNHIVQLDQDEDFRQEVPAIADPALQRSRHLYAASGPAR